MYCLNAVREDSVDFIIIYWWDNLHMWLFWVINYSKIVKPGGKLVYATCSVLPSENQEQIKHFLSTEIGKEFTFVQDRKVLAHESGFDGFYMALLERKNK